MRLCVFGLLLVLAPGLWAGEEKSTLEEAVRQFSSPAFAAREAASRIAAGEVKRLLAPLLEALNDPDPEVRRRARAALRMEIPARVPATVASWHPMKAVGPPDAVANQDHPNAWATKSGNMGLQWLELSYPRAMRVDRVRIFEVNRAGAVAEVITIDQKGRRRSVWKGIDPTKAPGVFDLKIPQTVYKVVGLRVVLDTNRVSGWNEIDAVELSGPDGREWAVLAVASSSYALAR